MKRKIRIIQVLLILAILLLGYSLIEPYRLKIHEWDLIHKDIPMSFNGIRVVFVSDIHRGPFLSQTRLGQVVEKINSLHPDLIMLGGDYVHRSPKYIRPTFMELSRLSAHLGIYAVLGNHDHWENAELTRQCMAQAGITYLDNRAEWVELNGDKIRLGGIRDFRPDLQPALAGVKPNDFVILLSHNPDYAEKVTDPRIDWIFSGHTHGGQVTFFGLWAPLLPSRYGQKYRSGFVQTPYTRVFVTTGIGTVTPPIRFCTRPEIVLIHLVRSQEAEK